MRKRKPLRPWPWKLKVLEGSYSVNTASNKVMERHYETFVVVLCLFWVSFDVSLMLFLCF